MNRNATVDLTVTKLVVPGPVPGIHVFAARE